MQNYREKYNLTFVGNGTFTTDVCVSGGNCLSTITGGATNSTYRTDYNYTWVGNFNGTGTITAKGEYVYGDTTTPYLRLSTGSGTVLAYSTNTILMNAGETAFNKKVSINNAELSLSGSTFSFINYSDTGADVGAIAISGIHTMGNSPIVSTNFLSNINWTSLKSNSIASSYRNLDLFNPSSTNVKFVSIALNPIINQTGSSSGDIIGIDLMDSSHAALDEDPSAEDNDWTQHWTTITTVDSPTQVTIPATGIPAGTVAFADVAVVTNRWRELAPISL